MDEPRRKAPRASGHLTRGVEVDLGRSAIPRASNGTLVGAVEIFAPIASGKVGCVYDTLHRLVIIVRDTGSNFRCHRSDAGEEFHSP